nr:hypothetical protein [Dictyobacter vulcani]
MNRAARELLDVPGGEPDEQLFLQQISVFDEHGLPLSLAQRPTARVLRGEHLGGQIRRKFACVARMDVSFN